MWWERELGRGHTTLHLGMTIAQHCKVKGGEGSCQRKRSKARERERERERETHTVDIASWWSLLITWHFSVHNKVDPAITRSELLDGPRFTDILAVIINRLLVFCSFQQRNINLIRSSSSCGETLSLHTLKVSNISY